MVTMRKQEVRIKTGFNVQCRQYQDDAVCVYEKAIIDLGGMQARLYYLDLQIETPKGYRAVFIPNSYLFMQGVIAPVFDITIENDLVAIPLRNVTDRPIRLAGDEEDYVCLGSIKFVKKVPFTIKLVE